MLLRVAVAGVQPDGHADVRDVELLGRTLYLIACELSQNTSCEMDMATYGLILLIRYRVRRPNSTRLVWIALASGTWAAAQLYSDVINGVRISHIDLESAGNVLHTYLHHLQVVDLGGARARKRVFRNVHHALDGHLQQPHDILLQEQ